MNKKERVQMYTSMLIASPGLIVKTPDDAKPKSAQEFAAECLKAAQWLDAEFEKIGMLEDE